ncbi:MAG: DNA polymerase III subunit gamma/tau, partial [Planctomycetaceae bacterium]|nr:DNA polymerase III subunit gamma/tau [Planctomycetaceae bacterium]
ARIFAKCLNCVQGPTESPCLICDICQAIAVGQDVDVIEIDGASNNGVEAVRELRQNAGLRPSRARFKIYYIDEVHMLSTGAFNALLKTLEEPPEHVKFFFATTEANKIPITVLSRCQRYDFAGIAPELIVATLAEIGAREGVEAEPEALRTIARRAAGSMRDAQSLLDQLLSSSNGRLTVEEVHRLLGTASDERLLDLIDALADHDAAAVLTQVDRAVREGVQPTDLLNGLLEFLRDLMVLSTGAEGTLLAATPRQRPRLQALIDRWPIDAILAALQIAAEARGKLRGSPHGRILVELALVRVARLENLSDLGELIARLAALESGAVPPTSVNHAALSAIKKKLTSPEPAVPASHQDSASGSAPPGPPWATRSPADDGPPLSLEAARQAWPEVIKLVGLRFGKGLGLVAPSAISGPNLLVIEVPPRYNWVVDECESVEARARIEQALQRLLHRPVSVRFDRSAEAEPRESPAQAATPGRRGDPAGDPMVQKVVELFEARPLHLEYEEDSSPSASS